MGRRKFRYEKGVGREKIVVDFGSEGWAVQQKYSGD